MKKVVLFAILALSINASAQSKHPKLPSVENIQGRMENTGIKTFDIHSERNFGQAIKHQTPDQCSLIQLYDSIYEWHWDTLSNGWKINNKYINYVYDAKNNLTSYIEQTWDGSIWMNYHYIYTYDVNKNLTSYIEQIRNGSVWVNFWQCIFTYDINSNQTNELEQEWNGSGWVNWRQNNCTYDADKNLTISISQNWDGSVWVNDLQWLCTYDANNNLTSELNQYWGNGNVWVNKYQYTYTYDTNNNLINELYQCWNGSEWVNSVQRIYTYDANNNRTSELVQDWYSNIWMNSSHYIYIYDANSDLTRELWQSWNGRVWVNYGQRNYTYDANNFEKSDSYKVWNSAGNMVTRGDSTYNYFHTVLGINNLLSKSNTLKIYPNPSSDNITIETSVTPAKSQLSIMNLNGQQLITRQITEPKTIIDISTLPSGVYFLRLTNDRTVKVGKLIKN